MKFIRQHTTLIALSLLAAVALFGCGASSGTDQAPVKPDPLRGYPMGEVQQIWINGRACLIQLQDVGYMRGYEWRVVAVF